MGRYYWHYFNIINSGGQQIYYIGRYIWYNNSNMKRRVAAKASISSEINKKEKKRKERNKRPEPWISMDDFTKLVWLFCTFAGAESSLARTQLKRGISSTTDVFFFFFVCVFMCFSLVDFDWIGKKAPLQKLLGEKERGGVGDSEF